MAARASTPAPAPAPAASRRGRKDAVPDQDARAAALEDLRLSFRGVFRTLSRLRGRDTHLGGSELSNAQFELLIELHERGALPAGELAAAARVTPATVTQMLDHLAAAGHVERVRSETDRRVVVSRLTPLGRARIEAKRKVWRERWEEALAGVPPEDLEAATRVLERLAGMLGEAPASESGGPARRPSARAPQAAKG
jgi:DNA-binding MarR family transcriptional regulator